MAQNLQPGKTGAKAGPDALTAGAAFLRWLTVVFLAFVSLIVALSAPRLISPKLQPGELSERDVFATHATEVLDEKLTLKAKEHAKQSVAPVFKRLDRGASFTGEVDKLLNQVPPIQRALGLPLPTSYKLTPEQFALILEQGETQSRQDRFVKGKHKESKAARKEQARLEQARLDYARLKREPQAINHQILLLALSVKPEEWPQTRARLSFIANHDLRLLPLLPGTSAQEWQEIARGFMPESWSESTKDAAAKLLASLLQPNVAIDSQATEKRMEEASAAVKPIMRQVTIGDILVNRGQPISPSVLQAMQDMGLTNTASWSTFAGLCFSVVAALALVGLFLFAYEPKHLYSASAIGLMATVSIGTLVFAGFAGPIFPQFIPLAAEALVLTIFFGPRVSTVITVLIMIFLRVDNLISMQDLVALATASVVAIGIHVKERKDLMLRGLLIGLFQCAGYTAFAVIGQTAHTIPEFFTNLIINFLGGLSSSIVAIGSLPFLENMFGMVTPLRITELIDPDQPLLRELEEKAPGTYQHSLAVANLAEAGAKAIGADPNLARAGSMYHDIGKMARPAYFIENQLGSENPHDSMSPEDSRNKVLAHVTDGIAFAQKHAVPREVIDFIPQHQGTTLMAYFYHKACQRDGVENVDANFYRYPGPKPQCKEAAIVMLADVSEAVTHSLKEPSQDEVEQQISIVFKARFDDGQFAESGLSYAELEKIKKAFARVWRTLHHERLKYPSTTTGRMAVAPDPQAINAKKPT